MDVDRGSGRRKVDRDTLRYTVRRDGLTLVANAYEGDTDVASATIKDPGHTNRQDSDTERPYVSSVTVNWDVSGNGIGQRVLETAIGAYPQGTEFTCVASNKEFVDRFRRLHPEIVLGDLPG